MVANVPRGAAGDDFIARRDEHCVDRAGVVLRERCRQVGAGARGQRHGRTVNVLVGMLSRVRMSQMAVSLSAATQRSLDRRPNAQARIACGGGRSAIATRPRCSTLEAGSLSGGKAPRGLLPPVTESMCTRPLRPQLATTCAATGAHPS